MFSHMICIIKHEGRRKQFLEFRFSITLLNQLIRDIQTRLDLFYIALHQVILYFPFPIPRCRLYRVDASSYAISQQLHDEDRMNHSLKRPRL